MSITYTPILSEVAFAKAHRRGVPVHRVRLMQHARSAETGEVWFVATWLWGGRSMNALPVEDPAEFGYTCVRCEATLTSAILYRCYSSDGHLLYIGSCVQWEGRVSLHEKDSPWWPEVARVDKTPQPSIGIARSAEIAAIRAEAPLHNKVHNVKRFRRDGHAFVPVTEAAEAA